MKFRAIIATVLVSSAALAQEPAPKAVQTFASNKFGFEVSYPSVWRSEQRPGTELYISRIYGPGAVASFSASATRYSGNKEEIHNALKEKSDRTKNLMTSIARERFPDFQVLDHKPTVLGNFPAYMVEGSYSLNNPASSYNFRNVIVMALHGDYIYRLNFEATETEFEAARKELNIILSTFNYKSAPGVTAQASTKPAAEPASSFATVRLRRGVSLDLPRTWWVLGKPINDLLAATTESVLEIAGVSDPGQPDDNLLAANSWPPSTYASVRVDYSTPAIGTPDEVRALTPEMLAEIRPELVGLLRRGLAAQNLQLLEDLGLTRETVGGHPALVQSYRRSGPKGPVVITVYTVQFAHGQVKVSLSYRESEVVLWKPVLQKIRTSIKFHDVAPAASSKAASSQAPPGMPTSLSARQQGELLGALGFGALTIDAYYELTVAKGHRTDNHLNGIDKLAKQKWGVTYSEIAKQQEAQSGRNFREEAQKLVRTMLQRFGGADTPGMKKWFSDFQDLHDANLKKFHALK